MYRGWIKRSVAASTCASLTTCSHSGKLRPENDETKSRSSGGELSEKMFCESLAGIFQPSFLSFPFPLEHLIPYIAH